MMGGLWMGEKPGEPTLRVLVVDDSAVVRNLISVNLELEGFDVSTAEDGEAAYALVEVVKPHVLTLDVKMPRLDGFETVARLRDNPATAHIPIVIVTARAHPVDVARAEELGVEAYLTKPFEPAELVAVVTRLAASGSPG